MTKKIDKRLLQGVQAFSQKNEKDCYIFYDNYDALKNKCEKLKVKILSVYSFINCARVTANIEQIVNLGKCDFINYISSAMASFVQMNVAKKILKVNKTTLTGKDVCVAFIDTGISYHMDFLVPKNRIEFFKDFVNDRNELYDDNGHGTFVAGVCSGSGTKSALKYSGIAPCTKIISLKALNASGEAGANNILDAMEWVFENHNRYDIKIVCMSFGSEPLGYNDPIMIGAEALWREGLVVIAAAGNSGPHFETIKSPGVSSKIITVGGFDDNRLDDENFLKDFFEIADFSSRGPAFKRIKPDLVAPCVDIISCGKDTYIKLSGTSVATPMVAGICALMFEKIPNIKNDEMKKLLLTMCRPIIFNQNLEGFGYPSL